MKSELILEIISELADAINKGDNRKVNAIIKQHPWVYPWTDRRHHFYLTCCGENVKFESKEILSDLRKERGLGPLLQIFVSSTEGRTCLNFESGSKGGFKVRYY